MIDSLLAELARDPAADVDLAEVSLYLAADEYPELDIPTYLSRIDWLADSVRIDPTDDLEVRVGALVAVLFEEEGFAGNAGDYYDPRNSYLNDVLDRKVGLPITLSVLAIAVGRRAGLEVVGVGLPGHFIAKAVDGDDEVLFDPFHGGTILSPADCEPLVEAATGRAIEVTPDLLAATPPGLIVTRVLNNLRGIYSRQEDWPRLVRVLGRLRQLDSADANLQRDLGVALIRAGRPGPAINHLREYLLAAPYAPDAEEVRQLVGRAVAEVARWN